MIGAVREWLTSVVVVTMFLSVVQVLLPEGTIRKIASFIVGLILLVTLIQPLLGANLERLELDLSGYRSAIEERREELENGSSEEMAGLIETRTAAYISEEAKRLGIQVTVRVETEPGTDGVPVPAAVEITGTRSQTLADWIDRELGIPAERQVWHERNDES